MLKNLTLVGLTFFLLLASSCNKESADGAKEAAGPAEAAAGSSLCAKAAGPLAGIVVLEVKDAGNDPSIMKTFESELTAECTAQKAEETAKDALECYDKNRSAVGYRLFKKCPEEPGKALVATVVAKHGAK